MNPTLKKICFLIWDTFAVFALCFTLALFFGLHPALLVAVEVIAVFLFLTHRAVTWANPLQTEENPSGMEIFRTAFRHCLRGFAILILLLWTVLLAVSLL